MVVKSKKDRIAVIIDALNEAASGDYSKKIDISTKNDELDSLVHAINKLLKKTGERLSGQKQTRSKLRTSEKRYKNILDSMEESYFEVDLKGNLLFFNDTVIRDLGYKSKDLDGLNFQQLVDKENGAKVYEAFHRVFLTGEAIKGFDWEILKKNGGKIDVESSVALLRDDKGRTRGFRGVVRDITKRKQADQELLRSEERYRTILDIMGDAYYELDLRGTYTFVNDTAYKIFGYRQNELIGMSYRDILTPQIAHNMQEAFSKIYNSGKPELLIDYEIIDKDGTVKIHRMNAALMRDAAGKPNGFRALAWDVTENKKAEEARCISEEKYRNILESMEETYLEADLKGNFVFFNDSLSKMLGYSRAELANMNYRNCIEPETIPKIFQIFNEIYRTDKPKTFITHELITKDGSKKIIEMSVSLKRDRSGNPAGFQGVARDVTEKIKAEEAIKQNEIHLRMITENIRDIIWTLGFDLHFTYISPSAYHITGYTPEELRRIPLNQQISPASYALIEKTLAEALARELSGLYDDQGSVNILELELMRKDGSNVWVEVIADFNRDENGKPFEVLGVTRDISEHKKMEEALRESEKRYRMIVENMHDIIWTMDLDLQYNYISPSSTWITGYTVEELKNIPVNKLLTPQSYAQVVSTLSEEIELEFSGKPINLHRSRTMDLEIFHKNGTIVWLEITAAFNRDENGKPVEILLAGRNITERKKIEEALKKSEKRFRMIVENMHDTVWTMDLNLHFKYISPGSTIMTGFTEEELRTIPLKEQIVPKSYAFIERILMEQLALESGGRPVDPKGALTFEVEAYHKDSGTIWIELTTTFNRDENGKPLEIVIAGRSITERKKMEEEKEKLEEQLLHAQKMESIGRLAGGVAHDFNNMLNVILGYAELSKMRLPEDNPVMHNIIEIEKAASRSKDITSQLLAFSRKQIIAPKIINLNEQIAGIEKTVARLIGEDINLFFHTQSDLWNIKIDPSQIEQILFNLIINARDAMPGGGKLTVETFNIHLDEGYCLNHADFQPGQYVLLTVSDNGHGIDTETLQHIFEPFFTTKETGKGTGLGLATVYGIIKQNGGFINVYSEPGQGTAFKIYFRRTEEVTQVEKVEEEPIFRASGTILLVEDDLPLREMTEEMLKTIGYSVLTVDNPMEAVSLCEKGGKHIDLVITDVVMPEMNGRELRDKLVVIKPDIKVLFMSGYTTNVIAHHGVLEKGVHFLQKPFSMKNLAQKISEVTGDK
jgi:PAS domain S-box-containing protein